MKPENRSGFGFDNRFRHQLAGGIHDRDRNGNAQNLPQKGAPSYNA
jgi:hypothetical protein